MSVLLLVTLISCKSECLGRDCDDVPDVPWDPGEGGSDDGYGGSAGGGDGGGDGGSGEDTGRELLTVRDCEVVLSHTPSGSPGTVEVSGEFNGWSPQPMSGPDADGRYSVDLGALDPGEYAFKYVYDGEYESAPPVDVYTKWVGDSENRDLRVGDCMLPLLQTVSASASAGGHLQATVQIASAADEVPIDTVRVTVGGDEVSAELDAETGELTVDVTGLAPGKHSVKVWATDEAGRAAENEPLWIPLWVEDEAWEWDDALLYFVFTDRFRNGDWGEDTPWGPVDGVADCANFEGGDYLGVEQALEEDYFDNLGVNTLWLSPVYDNPDGAYIGADGVNMYSGYHGYWPIDPGAVEEHFGDTGADADQRLRELIDEAHSRGMRVLFDLVLNHVHEDHVYVAEHPEWFGDGCVCGTDGCGWDDKPIECWFMPYLPDLNYKNGDITTRVLDDTMDLLRTYDVDAVRVDAAKHMDHVVMRSLRKRLRDEVEAGGGASFWLVGETFTGDRSLIMDYVGDHELSGQFDFPLYYAIQSAFIDGGSFNDLASAVRDGQAAYGDAVMSPFLGNHDVDRFATAYDGAAGDCWSGWTEDPMADGGSAVDQWDLINAESMAFAFTLTQPGVPLIYYGDEIGLHGGEDPDNRRIMSFEPYLSANQETLLARVQAIGRARAEHAALRRGTPVELWTDDDLLVYARDLGGGDVAIVAMNKGWSTRSEQVPVSSLSLSDGALTDLIGGASFSVSGGSLSLSLGSQQYVILVP